MSKFFNETQKASQWAHKRLGQNDLDIKQMLETLKQGSTSGTEVAEVRLQPRLKVRLGSGNNAALILSEDDSAQAALEAYRGLRTKLMRVQGESGLRSIAITSSIPGEGKTLTVMNLGLCYSQLPEHSVLVIDSDLRTRGLTQMVGHPSVGGLAEVLTGQVAPDEAILATDHKNLFVLPAGSVSTAPPDHFTGPRWAEFVGWCGETFKVVLVDTPPILPLPDFELISAACDAIVMVVRAHFGPHDTVQKATSGLDRKKLLGVVLNAAEHGGKKHYGYDYGHR